MDTYRHRHRYFVHAREIDAINCIHIENVAKILNSFTVKTVVVLKFVLFIELGR